MFLENPPFPTGQSYTTFHWSQMVPPQDPNEAAGTAEVRSACPQEEKVSPPAGNANGSWCQLQEMQRLQEVAIPI